MRFRIRGEGLNPKIPQIMSRENFFIENKLSGGFSCKFTFEEIGPNCLEYQAILRKRIEGVGGFNIWFGSLFERIVQGPNLGVPCPPPHQH
jgi:hypothetical protein